MLTQCSFQFACRSSGPELDSQLREQLLGIYRATRNCYSGKVPDEKLAERYLAKLESHGYQLLTLEHAGAVHGSVLAARVANGDWSIGAVCATSSEAFHSLLRHALRWIRGQQPKRIVTAVAPEVRIANLLFGALGFEGTGLRDWEPGVSLFDASQTPGARGARTPAFDHVLRTLPPGYVWSEAGRGECHARRFEICTPDSPRYADCIATLQQVTAPLFATGHRLVHYRLHAGSARCVFLRGQR